jgi:hypothetical protein
VNIHDDHSLPIRAADFITSGFAAIIRIRSEFATRFDILPFRFLIFLLAFSILDDLDHHNAEGRQPKVERSPMKLKSTDLIEATRCVSWGLSAELQG